jgi:hypothetical protein
MSFLHNVSVHPFCLQKSACLSISLTLYCTVHHIPQFRAFESHIYSSVPFYVKTFTHFPFLNNKKAFMTFHRIPSKFLPYDENFLWGFHHCTQLYPHTANEGPVRIQHKCLIPINVFLKMKLCSLLISKREFLCSVSQFQHSYICERFIYFQDRSV